MPTAAHWPGKVAGTASGKTCRSVGAAASRATESYRLPPRGRSATSSASRGFANGRTITSGGWRYAAAPSTAKPRKGRPSGLTLRIVRFEKGGRERVDAAAFSPAFVWISPVVVGAAGPDAGLLWGVASRGAVGRPASDGSGCLRRWGTGGEAALPIRIAWV